MAKAMLPKQIDPFQLADNGTILKGDLSLIEMVRLHDFLSGKDGIVQIRIEFGRDAQRFAFMKGSIKTEFQVVCQRCGSPMSLSFDIPVNDGLIRDDKEALRLPKGYEPLLVTSDTMSFVSLIEEEILLSIPLVPKHSAKECLVQSSDLTEWEEKKDDTNPFSNLKKLLRE